MKKLLLIIANITVYFILWFVQSGIVMFLSFKILNSYRPSAYIALGSIFALFSSYMLTKAINLKKYIID
jgi:hypothetical protein